MNLVSDGIDLKTERTKKIIKISIILAVILFFIVLAIMLYYNYVESQTLKLYIDRERMEIPQNLFSYDQNSGTLYVSIEDLASIAGYEYYRGDYNKLTEKIQNVMLTTKKKLLVLNQVQIKCIKLIQLQILQIMTGIL